MQSTYALVLADLYGWGAAALGAVLVCAGLEIAVLQGVLVKKICARIGKHGAAILGAVCLGFGLGLLPVVVNKPLHFLAYAIHVFGFSICNTAIPALVTRYASSKSQGKSLGLNNAAASASRVVSPIVSGILFDVDMTMPYLVGGALCLTLAVLAPVVLLFRSRRAAANVENAASPDSESDSDDGGEPVSAGAV